jgi:sec-independent protein translocase protein TatA
MFDPSPAHLAILAVVILLLFGSKRLPDAARSLGQSLRIFKAETKGLREDSQPASPPVQLPQTLASPDAAQQPAATPATPPESAGR